MVTLRVVPGRETDVATLSEHPGLCKLEWSYVVEEGVEIEKPPDVLQEQRQVDMSQPNCGGGEVDLLLRTIQMVSQKSVEKKKFSNMDGR